MSMVFSRLVATTSTTKGPAWRQRTTRSFLRRRQASWSVNIASPNVATSKVANPHLVTAVVLGSAISIIHFYTDTTFTSTVTDCDRQPQRIPSAVKDTYKVTGILGEGAFGIVYEAIRRRDSQRIALKAIHRDTSTSSDDGDESSSKDQEDFEREIHALVVLSNPGHAHVCQLYDQHQDADYFFLEMELIEGGELFEHLIRKGPFSERDASTFLRQFASALSYIHSKGLVHMDLKPENLMMDSSWDALNTNTSTTDHPAKLKVVDFGCTCDTQTILKPDGFGTRAYLPPELQFLGGSPPPSMSMVPTPAVDMFAAGIIMYIILTGSHPFDPTGEAAEEDIVVAIRNSSTTPGFLDTFVFDERVANLSSSAMNLMRVLMHPNPRRRLSSQQLLVHPWIQGVAASDVVMKNSDKRLARFWQKRFQAAVVKKFCETTKSSTPFLSEANLKLVFQTIDLDGSESLSIDELKVALSDLLGEGNMQDILNSLDADHDGSIDFEEFKSIMLMSFDQHADDEAQARASAQLRSKLLERLGVLDTNLNKDTDTDSDTFSKEDLRRIFDAMDLNGDGSLQFSEILYFLHTILEMDKETVSSWADLVDTDMDGSVNFEEFCRAMERKDLLIR